MQPYVTPQPGRAPGANIVNRADYKLDVQLTEFRPQEYLFSINRYMPETAWQRQQFFLTLDELNEIRKQLNESR